MVDELHLPVFDLHFLFAVAVAFVHLVQAVAVVVPLVQAVVDLRVQAAVVVHLFVLEIFRQVLDYLRIVLGCLLLMVVVVAFVEIRLLAAFVRLAADHPFWQAVFVPEILD